MKMIPAALLTLGMSLVAILPTSAVAASTFDPQGAEALEPMQANLVVYRDKGLASNSHMYYRLFVDGKLVGKLKRNTAFHLQLGSGEHRIGFNDEKQTSMTVNVSDDSTTFIKGTVDRHWQIAIEQRQPKSGTLLDSVAVR